jgi:hypothetical protein
MAKQKTHPTEVDVIDFIEKIEHETKKADAYFILNYMKELTGLNPRMWGPSIIGFGKYHYKYKSGHEGYAPMLGFSPRKARHVIYVLTKFKKQEDLLEKLGKYKTGKVCLYINKLKDVDTDVLKEIIAESWQQTVDRYGISDI